MKNDMKKYNNNNKKKDEGFPLRLECFHNGIILIVICFNFVLQT